MLQVVEIFYRDDFNPFFLLSKFTSKGVGNDINLLRKVTLRYAWLCVEQNKFIMWNVEKTQCKRSFLGIDRINKIEIVSQLRLVRINRSHVALHC